MSLNAMFGSTLYQSLMHDLQDLDGYLRGASLEIRPVPLDGVRALKVPPPLLMALRVAQHHRAIFALDLAAGYIPLPVPQGVIVGQSALQYDVGVLGAAHDLSHI